MGDKLQLVIGAALLICAYLWMAQAPGCTRDSTATEIQTHQPATRAHRGTLNGVAGGRIERPSPGNEPGVLPLHKPAQS